MAKTRISREALTAKVLAAIRQQPGCEGVKEVAVSVLKIVDGESTWRVAAIDSGEVKTQKAYHAAQQVEEKLVPRFELVVASGEH